MAYDIIGDIHGCADTLASLLIRLGYTNEDGVFHHTTRKVIFLGDFIDRGPKQRDVIRIVRSMIDAGHACSVMGNHEFNAISYAAPSDNGDDYLRAHSDKNTHQHQAFLEAFPFGGELHTDTIEWFKTLPLWLDLGELRIIHACWDESLIQYIDKYYNGNQLTDELLYDSCDKSNFAYEAIETLLKGKEIPLPDHCSFHDKDGNVRNHIRIRWWDQGATTYRNIFMGPASATTHIPDAPVDADHLIEYSHSSPPVFLGHYWLSLIHI